MPGRKFKQKSTVKDSLYPNNKIPRDFSPDSLSRCALIFVLYEVFTSLVAHNCRSIARPSQVLPNILSGYTSSSLVSFILLVASRRLNPDRSIRSSDHCTSHTCLVCRIKSPSQLLHVFGSSCNTSPLSVACRPKWWLRRRLCKELLHEIWL